MRRGEEKKKKWKWAEFILGDRFNMYSINFEGGKGEEWDAIIIATIKIISLLTPTQSFMRPKENGLRCFRCEKLSYKNFFCAENFTVVYYNFLIPSFPCNRRWWRLLRTKTLSMETFTKFSTPYWKWGTKKGKLRVEMRNEVRP